MKSEMMQPQRLSLSEPFPRVHLVARVGAILNTWFERMRQREALARLDASALRDLGLSEADVWRERSKSVWEA